MARYGFALWAGLVMGVGVGNPALATTVTVQLANYPVVVRVYDMNGDGHLDIVTAADDVDNTADWVLTVLRGYGNTSGHVGQFYAAQTKDLVLDDETFVLTDLGLGKAGGDTYPDAFFVLQNPPYDKVYRISGNNDGTFGTKTSWNTNDDVVSLNVFDRDGNAYADVAYVTSVGAGADTLGLRCGNSTGGFGNEQIGDGTSPDFLRMADVLGACGGGLLPSCIGSGGAGPDGTVDYIMAKALGDIVVNLANNNCTLTTTKYTSSTSINESVLDVAVGDVTGDGKKDVVILTGGKLWTATGNGNGTFNTASSSTIEDGAEGLVLVDVDGDGDLDAVTVGNDVDVGGQGKVVIHTNNGSGTWSTSTSYTVEDAPTNIVAGDMDENGTPDFIVGSRGAGTITIIER